LMAQHTQPHLAVGDDGTAACGITRHAAQRRSDAVFRKGQGRWFGSR
jgi:hypothetical protein